MIKTLIVEDEILARLGLRQLIDWESLGFSLLEDARDGRSALEILDRERPQLLLLDINIPEVNGLQVLEFIRDRGIGCATIVISCDNDLNTVKQAMKLGAVDYFHKMSLTPNDLLLMLSKYREAWEEGAPSPPSYTADRGELEYEDVLQGEHANKLGLSFATGYTLCVVPPGRDRKGLERAVQIARETWEERKLPALLVRGSQCLFFLVAGDQGNDLALYHLKGALESALCGPVYLGVGPVWRDVSRSKESLLLAEQVCTLAFYDKEPGIYPLEEKLPYRDQASLAFHCFCEELYRALESWDQPGAACVLRRCIGHLREQEFLPACVLRRMLMDLLSAYSSRADALGGMIEEISLDGTSNHYGSIMALSGLSRVEEWFLQFSASFFAAFHLRAKCSRSELLQQVLSYVDAHLHGTIRLSAIGREIGVSEAYLSSFFKREMGENLVSYVNRRKVEAAKELLLQGKLVYQVSEQLGFEHTTYFSRIFKRYVGATPDSFRKHHPTAL